MSACDNWFTSKNEIELAICEVHWWVNGKGILKLESYTRAEVEEVIRVYHSGVLKNEIPEWVQPRDPVIEQKIINYLNVSTRALRAPVDPRVRAIFANLVNSTYINTTGRERINPCILHPKTENCVTSPLSADYLNNKNDSSNNPFTQISNLMQSATILVVVGAAAYFGSKLLMLTGKK